VLLYAALTVAGLVAARLVYRYDLYDREPWYVSLAVVIAGGVAMRGLGSLEDAAIHAIGDGTPTTAQIALVAASFEESVRLLIVLTVALAAPRYFNDPMDGLIYGSMVGIGMAVEETIHWTATGTSVAAAIPVELVRLFGHVLMGGITGFGIGLMRRHGAGSSWIPTAVACLAAGTALHFTWDYIALVSATRVGDTSWPVFVSIGLMLAGMLGYASLVVLGSRWSREQFAPTSRVRVWRR
jgi:protease PrsW